MKMYQAEQAANQPEQGADDAAKEEVKKDDEGTIEGEVVNEQ